MNHLIAEDLPFSNKEQNGRRISNSSPVTGQTGWFDVRVKVYKCTKNEAKITLPQFNAQTPLPGVRKRQTKFMAYVSGKDLFSKLLKGGK